MDSVFGYELHSTTWQRTCLGTLRMRLGRAGHSGMERHDSQEAQDR